MSGPDTRRADAGSGASFDLDDERLARAAWSRLAEPGDEPARALVQHLGPGGALRAVLAGHGEARWRARWPDLHPLRDLSTVERLGARWVIPGDDEWPESLDGYGLAAPFGLYIRGPARLDVVASRSVAIIGSRAATSYGVRVAESLARGCADHTVAVVSGAAFGIDGAAHRGALEAEGVTVAVLACGIDRVYPRGHDTLIARIGERGALVSEVPPGSSPTRWRFVERNRLIAGLSQLVVVVEAAHRSGAASTAARATKHGIPVAAVPGPVTSPNSYGTNTLLRDGAICVTSVEHILELVSRVGESTAESVPSPRAAHDGLPPADLRVYDALPLRRGAAVESLVKVAGLEVPTVLAALGRLELAGLAQRAGGNGWLRSAPPPGESM